MQPVLQPEHTTTFAAWTEGDRSDLNWLPGVVARSTEQILQNAA